MVKDRDLGASAMSVASLQWLGGKRTPLSLFLVGGLSTAAKGRRAPCVAEGTVSIGIEELQLNLPTKLRLFIHGHVSHASHDPNFAVDMENSETRFFEPGFVSRRSLTPPNAPTSTSEAFWSRPKFLCLGWVEP